MGIGWTTTEVAVILYFASRGVAQADCHRILQSKCVSDNRTFMAVRGKLLLLRKDFWDAARNEWDTDPVD